MHIIYLGMGKMGGSMALRLADEGHSVTVWNRSRARADAVASKCEHAGRVQVAGTLEEALGSNAEAPIVMMVDSISTVHALLKAGEEGRLWAGRTVVNLTSGNPDEGREVARRMSELGAAHYVDGCFSGGPDKARSGKGMVFASSDDEAVTRKHFASFLDACGQTVWSGPVGASRALDYAAVDLSLAMFVCWSSAAAMMDKEGVSQELFLQCATQRFATMPGVLSVLQQRAGDRSDAAYAANPIATIDTWKNFVGSRLPYMRENNMNTEYPEFLSGLLERVAADGHGGDDFTRLQEITRFNAQHLKKQ